MVAQVAGRLSGIAKKARVTMVTAGKDFLNQGLEPGIDMLVKTYDDIRENRVDTRKGHAVVTMSWDYELVEEDSKTSWRAAPVAAIIKLIDELVKLDVVCVTSAGNGEPVSRHKNSPIVYLNADSSGHTYHRLPCGTWVYTARLDSRWRGRQSRRAESWSYDCTVCEDLSFCSGIYMSRYRYLSPSTVLLKQRDFRG